MLFTYLPILSLVVFSFNEGKSLTRWTGFSLQWYVKLFESDEIMRCLATTIIIALISTLISTVIGTLAAIALSKSRKILRELTLSANNIPIVNPEIVTAISLLRPLRNLRDRDGA